MSRIRTIKPEFWVSEQILSCSPNARLLFIGMWNFADDHGVHPASYIRLKAEIFPADNCTSENIKTSINELIKNGLIREYTVEGKSYWIVTGWGSHQRIDRPTYRYPTPESSLKTIVDNSTTTRRELIEASQSTLRIVDESSTTEWNGMDRNGKDLNIGEVETSPCDISDSTLSASNQVFQHWQTVMNHPHAKLDKKRKGKIKQALKLGYSVADLKQAIDGCAKTPFNMGKNDNGQRYDDIGLILRDAAHIDRFINNATTVNAQLNTGTNDNLMEGVI